MKSATDTKPHGKIVMNREIGVAISFQSLYFQMPWKNGLNSSYPSPISVPIPIMDGNWASSRIFRYISPTWNRLEASTQTAETFNCAPCRCCNDVDKRHRDLAEKWLSLHCTDNIHQAVRHRRANRNPLVAPIPKAPGSLTRFHGQKYFRSKGWRIKCRVKVRFRPTTWCSFKQKVENTDPSSR